VKGEFLMNAASSSQVVTGGRQWPVREDAQDILSVLARKHPDKPAVIDDRPDGTVESVTFAQFNRRVNKLANALLTGGLRAGERVVWCSRNSTEPLILQQAARKLQAQSVALHPRATRTEAVLILNAAKAALLFVEPDLADTFAGIENETDVRSVVSFGDSRAAGVLPAAELTANASDAEPDAMPGDPFVSTISFTSGTTGKPKGVIRGPMPPGSSEARLLDRIWGPKPHVYLTSGSWSHGGPGGHGMRALLRGDTVIMQRRFDPEDWLRLVEKYKVSYSYCAPTIIRQVCNLPDEVKRRYDISSIRVIFAGAAKWSYALKLAYRRDFPENTLWEIYGSTELASNTVMGPAEHWGKPESCGKAVEGVDIVLVDENGDVVAKPYERGILYAKCDSMLATYDGDNQAFREASWGDGYFTVGDIAYFDEDGFYYICDRQKDMIVSGGVNIYPAEIEAVLDSCPGVFESAVIGIPDPDWGERVHALVIARDGAEVTEQGIIDYCREHLSGHKVPRSVEFTGDFPRTPVGKILKRVLRQRYWADSGRSV
jgi:acyl-CoA synthetase (AMP-forming)/AMP-acid ligase II